MRLDLSKYGDIKPLHRGAVVDTFFASTTSDPAYEVCLKFFRAERIGASPELEARFATAVAASMASVAAEVLRPIACGETTEGPAYVVPRLRGVSLRRLRDLFVAHREPLPVDLAVYIADEILRILVEHGSEHGSLTLAAIRFDTAGHTYLTEPGIWAVFGHEAVARRVAAGAGDYLPPEQHRGTPTDRSCDVYAVGMVLRALLSCADAREITPDLEAFVRAASAEDARARHRTPEAARHALRSAHAIRASVASMREWLAVRAIEHDGGVAVVAPPPAEVERGAEPSYVEPLSPRPVHAPIDAKRSSAPLRAPRSHAADKDRVVVHQSGSLWAIFVVCLMVGFVGSMAFSFVSRS